MDGQVVHRRPEGSKDVFSIKGVLRYGGSSNTIPVSVSDGSDCFLGGLKVEEILVVRISWLDHSSVTQGVCAYEMSATRLFTGAPNFQRRFS